MHEIVERLMVLAAPKKKAPPKYTKDVENLFDELLIHFVEESDYTKNDRAFRLMMRIRKALEAEGYSFRNKPTNIGPELKPTLSLSSKNKYLLCMGGMCTLLKTKPPTGLDLHATMKLMEFLGSKQCYQYTIKPSSPELVRKNGINVSLPKPLTWAKLENFGLTRENVITNDGRTMMEKFIVDGITAYTLDRKTFYVSNAGMCRRWMLGLDRVASDACEK